MIRRGRSTEMRRRYACLPALRGCGALPGEHCRTRAGTETLSVHAARWDQFLGRTSSRAGMGARVGIERQETTREQQARLRRRLGGLATDLEDLAAAIRAVLQLPGG